MTASFKFTSLSLNVAFPAAIFLMKSVFDPCNFTRGGWLLHRHSLFHVSQLFIEISKDSLKRGSLVISVHPILRTTSDVKRVTEDVARSRSVRCQTLRCVKGLMPELMELQLNQSTLQVIAASKFVYVIKTLQTLQNNVFSKVLQSSENNTKKLVQQDDRT